MVAKYSWGETTVRFGSEPSSRPNETTAQPETPRPPAVAGADRAARTGPCPGPNLQGRAMGSKFRFGIGKIAWFVYNRDERREIQLPGPAGRPAGSEGGIHGDGEDSTVTCSTLTRSPTNFRYQEDATNCHTGQREELRTDTL
jgi:hypothetical protein